MRSSYVLTLPFFRARKFKKKIYIYIFIYMDIKGVLLLTQLEVVTLEIN